jgi:aminomethyltransferase
MPAAPVDPATLRQTPLAALHRRLGARMVPFAGYEMPVQYKAGIVAEHVWTRTNAGLFDVSHMGQIVLDGADQRTLAMALERLVPADIAGLEPDRIRYTQFIASTGGIIDDLMVTRPAAEEGRLMLVVNASRKAIDEAWLRENLPPDITVTAREDLALVALQGPRAGEVIGSLAPATQSLGFMTAMPARLAGIEVQLARSGYTGEDGFEISLAAGAVERLVETLLADERVRPAGLGARDTLRLEAGLCLYGQDIDESTSPIEAELAWSIPARRRQALDFIGAERIGRELATGAARRRVGLAPQGRIPVRHGAPIRDAAGTGIGMVTSGGFGPTVDAPVAMGYVPAGLAAAGTVVDVMVRDKPVPAVVTRLPFVPHRYRR